MAETTGAAKLGARLRAWAARVKRDTVALWFAGRDPRTPRPVKVLIAVVVAYALSPIDLIPDFIPLLGYLDELILLPALIGLAVRLMPADVLDDCRRRGDDWIAAQRRRPRSAWGGVLIVVVWICIVGVAAWWWHRRS